MSATTGPIVLMVQSSMRMMMMIPLPTYLLVGMIFVCQNDRTSWSFLPKRTSA